MDGGWWAVDGGRWTEDGDGGWGTQGGGRREVDGGRWTEDGGRGWGWWRVDCGEGRRRRKVGERIRRWLICLYDVFVLVSVGLIIGQLIHNGLWYCMKNNKNALLVSI